MSLEEAARTELLRMRRHGDGVTVAALARTEALRRVLGGGDPRVAYNALKHILLVNADDLSVTAASYSLGFASDGKTHLDRLNDFGAEYSYDQRQARRYSDKGVVEIARYIASEWTIEASPRLELEVLRADNEWLEFYLVTERFFFINMTEPLVEVSDGSGNRLLVKCRWQDDEAQDEGLIRSATSVAVQREAGASQAISIVWLGEVWPAFAVMCSAATLPSRLRFQSLGTRLQIDA